MAISNQPKITNDDCLNKQRDRIIHRGLWMGLLLKQMKDSGMDWNEIGRKAIFNCGCIHGQGIKKAMDVPGSLVSFSNTFFNDNIKKLFEIEIIEQNEDVFKCEYRHCPLLTAWESLGFEGEFLDQVCDIAMEGDRGITSQFDEFRFELGKTLAQGHNVCEVAFYRKK